MSVCMGSQPVGKKVQHKRETASVFVRQPIQSNPKGTKSPKGASLESYVLRQLDDTLCHCTTSASACGLFIML